MRGDGLNEVANPPPCSSATAIPTRPEPRSSPAWRDATDPRRAAGAGRADGPRHGAPRRRRLGQQPARNGSWRCWRPHGGVRSGSTTSISMSRAAAEDHRAGGGSRRRGGARLLADRQSAAGRHGDLRRGQPLRRDPAGFACGARLKEAAKLGFGRAAAPVTKPGDEARGRSSPRHRPHRGPCGHHRGGPADPDRGNNRWSRRLSPDFW